MAERTSALAEEKKKADLLLYVCPVASRTLIREKDNLCYMRVCAFCIKLWGRKPSESSGNACIPFLSCSIPLVCSIDSHLNATIFAACLTASRAAPAAAAHAAANTTTTAATTATTIDNSECYQRMPLLSPSAISRHSHLPGKSHIELQSSDRSSMRDARIAMRE